MFRVAFAQLDPVVGAFEANLGKIRESYERACAEQARLLLTPELGVCGYPPHDLLDRPEMLNRNERALAELVHLTRGKSCALVVGHVSRNLAPQGRAIQNSVSVLFDGKEVHRVSKSLLPTYDVFDEARYFEPASSLQPWVSPDGEFGIAICEDLWGKDPAQPRKLYRADPVDGFRAHRPRLLISISASPYEWGKRERREAIHAELARELGCPVLYVNQVGANDEILFDGASFAVDSAGDLIGRLPEFETAFACVDLDLGTGRGTFAGGAPSSPNEALSSIAVLHRGLVRGIRDYFVRNGMNQAVLGLSGGIDSAVVAALAVEALGPRNVLGVAMPSQYSSAHSLADAEASVRALGCAYEVKPIKFLFTQAVRELSEGRGTLAPLAAENIQARLRGLILMTLANHHNALVLTTGNKSELSTGYCTLYGDMCGALAPIGDLFKTRVYELAREMNRAARAAGLPLPIPENSIVKAPSAELRPDQRDQDTLPPYEALDPLLEDYLEKNLSLSELQSRHAAQVAPKQGEKPGQWIEDTLRRLELNEFKRRQAAPVLKISTKAYGIGRRVPLSKVWSTSDC